MVINGMTDDPQPPWGGFKFSGVGREYGHTVSRRFSKPALSSRHKETSAHEQYTCSVSPEETADRLAIRELVEAYAYCADRRDAKGQMNSVHYRHPFRGVYERKKIRSRPKSCTRARSSLWSSPT